MKHNAKERAHEIRFASVFDDDDGNVLRFIRPFIRQIARRHVCFKQNFHLEFLLSFLFPSDHLEHWRKSHRQR